MAKQTTLPSGFQSNQKLWHDISCNPHESQELADKEVDAFLEAVQELRQKHRIKNLLVTLEIDHVDVDQGVQSKICTSATGQITKLLPLAAYEYGLRKREHQEMIDELLGKSGSS